MDPGDDGTPRVAEYMTRDVDTVSPSSTVGEVARRIAESDEHSGFPVTVDRRVEGFVAARDLLLEGGDAPIETVMAEELIVADPEMKVTDAARVILRSGIQKLPVVDDDGTLVGIITNADVIRSQIERATPEKVGKLVRTLERIHDVELRQERREVPLAALVPTQSKVYADELEGRRYELERGLAEPLVVIDHTRTAAGSVGAPGTDGAGTPAEGSGTPAGGSGTPAGRLLLADGHHRVKAARRLGIEEMDAYVIVVDDPVDLGMARTAEKEGLSSLADVEVVDYARHPLVETTERLQ